MENDTLETNNDHPAEQLLNEYQIRKVRITLQGFEEDLRFALEWLDRSPGEGILYNRKLVLPKDLRERARQKIQEGLEEIRKLANSLDLVPENENVARDLMGRLAIDWESLSSIHARDLRGFGEVHPKAGQFLDNPADRLSNIALQLSQIFFHGPIEIKKIEQPED